MASPINMHIGRQRITHVTGPHEANYVRMIRRQTELIRNNLKKVLDGIEGVTPEALIVGLQPIYDESQILVPVKTGRLKRSGFLVAQRTATGATATIGYGRGGQPHYTSLVHERLDFFHRPPTRAKFLEEPINKHIGNLGLRVVQHIRRRTGLTD